MQTVDDYIKSVTTLPPAPRVLTKLLELLAEPDAEPSQVVELVTYDPALTGKVLQRCNSAAGGLAEPVCNLDEAVMRVGFNEIYRFVAEVVGKGALGEAQPGYGISAGELWEHSVVSAMGARAIAAKLQEDQNVAFTAALLHDIGKLVLSSYLNQTGSVAIEENVNSGHAFLEAEKTLLGVDHAEVGGRLLEHWSFPAGFSNAIRFHHDPLKARPDERLASLVYLGDLIAHFLGYSYGFQTHAVRGRTDALDILGLNAQDVEGFILQTNLALNDSTWIRSSQA
jgi:putative nucleotidyltransferase with HDIG domain